MAGLLALGMAPPQAAGGAASASLQDADGSQVGQPETTGQTAHAETVDGESAAAPEEAGRRTPLIFEPNQGQTDSRVDYLARGPGYTLFLDDGDAVFDLTGGPDEAGGHPTGGQGTGTAAGEGSPAGAVVRLNLLGSAAEPSATGTQRLEGASNYLRGDDPSDWHTGVAHYAAVRYQGVYPGIDAVYRSDDNDQLEYDFHLAPGADAEAITLGFDGAEGLRLGEDGALLVDTAVGTLRQQAPVAYQPTDDGREPVKADFVRRGENQVGFALGDHDPNAPVVIDPVVVYSSYLGGNRTDEAHDVAADDAGNAYVTGLTQSANFPTTTGAYDTTCETDGCGDTTDAFVTKVDTNAAGDGPAVAYSTYLGGGRDDRASGVGVDADGAAYVAGTTNSDDFPTPRGFDGDCGADDDGACETNDAGNALSDAFVAKLAPDGSGLDYAAYLGGNGHDTGLGIAVEGTNAYVTGNSRSEFFFPTSSSAFQSSCDNCAFVTKVTGDGSGLAYSTLLGGNRRDRGRSIAVSDNSAYVTGDTTSTDFPTTDGAFDRSCQPGQQDEPAMCSTGAVGDMAFVTKLEPSGSGLAYSTYLGEDGVDIPDGVAADDAGHAYVTGTTLGSDFPTTDGAFQTASCDDSDEQCAFVTKFNADGSALAYSSRFGSAGTTGFSRSRGYDVALDGAGRAHVTGWTDSKHFPLTDDAYPNCCATGRDVFLSVLAADGTSLDYSTLLDGSGFRDQGQGVAVDVDGDTYVAGFTDSGDFPAMDATQRSHGGARDGFLTKVTPQPQRPIVYSIDEARGPTAGGTEVQLTGRSLGDVTEVRFGDQPVADEDLTVVSDTRITVTSPPVGPPRTRPATVDVTATDARGTSPPTSRARFSYVQGRWTAVGGFDARADHSATRLNGGHLLIAGGHTPPNPDRPVFGADTDTTILTSTQTYDPATGQVSDVADMPTARTRHSATRLPDGRVLVAGGSGADGQALNTATVYDPQAEDTSQAWSSAEPMNTARTSHTATQLPDGRVLVIGGLASPDGQELDSVEVYDPGNGQWTTLTPLTHGRGKQTATLLDDGRVLLVGGITLSSDGIPDIAPPEVYDPSGGGASSELGSGPRRFQHSATKLEDGRVLVAGGITALIRGRHTSNPTSTDRAVLYDPTAAAADAWQPTAPMGTGRGSHAARRLANGRVLVAGGIHDSQDLTDPLAGALTETYDPGDGEPAAWLPSTAMQAARYSPVQSSADNNVSEKPTPHTATLLSADPAGFAADPAMCGDQCGRVLVVGGADDPPAELYTPAPSVSAIDPTSGDQGTAVTLTGAGFFQGTEVFFGETPATDVTVDSFGQLTATAPAGATGDNVQVTVLSEGGLAPAPESFTYATTGGGGDDGGDVGDGGDATGDGTEPAAVDDPDAAPGQVDDLAADAQSNTEIGLSFSAVSADGDGQAPPAGEYVVKQSTEPIDSDAAFEDAFALCGGVCSFGPAAVGDELTLTVTDLDPGTTYHYAVKARDEAGNLSELSNPASATTTGEVVGNGPATACAEAFVPDGGFGDVAGNVHESAIACVAWYRITLGMGDLDGDGTPDYGPRRPITRDQMASFLVRLAAEAGLELPADAPNAFGDDDGSVHEPRINALAALGITEGKGDVDGDGQADYAPREPVSRDQMASFLARLHQRVTGSLPQGPPDAFGDDDGSVHEDNINALAALGITEGKGDVDGDGQDEYAPREPVFRDQMASFLARELDKLAEAGAVHPGGAEVLLEATEVSAGGELAGRVRSNRQVTGLTADGCGLAGQAVSLGEQTGFTVGVPADLPGGACELTLTVTTAPVDPAAEGDGQDVPYRFDVTVTE